MGELKLTEYNLQHYTLQQVALMSGFSLKSIQRFAREGKLVTKKVQGRRMVTKKAYAEFMEISD